MDFTFTEEQKMLRGLVKEFMASEIIPIASVIDEKEDIPLELIKNIAEVGFLGVAFPEKYGGGGIEEVGYCIKQEEISRG
ncbi:MAG: acyl-CoA dehydrogenase family protein [Ignavibacteriaceae bacterium]